MRWWVMVYVVVVGLGGWRLVRGHGQGWRLLVWLTLLFGPFGAAATWLLMRHGARLGASAAAGPTHESNGRPERV